MGEWTRSGDKYIEDDDGYYVYCGRQRRHAEGVGHVRLAVRGRGALCHRHPDVLEAAVVGWNDEQKLIKPKAFVVLKSPEKAERRVWSQVLQEHVKAKLAPYKYPRWIEFRKDLPKTATGKIQRFVLRAEGSSKNTSVMTDLPDSGFLDIGTQRLEYRFVGPRPGSAPTLVLLHEGLGCVGLWGDFPEKLAGGNRAPACSSIRAPVMASRRAVALPRPLSYMHDEARETLAAPARCDRLQMRRA